MGGQKVVRVRATCAISEASQAHMLLVLTLFALLVPKVLSVIALLVLPDARHLTTHASAGGTQFTCFTSTQVQIFTQHAARLALVA